MGGDGPGINIYRSEKYRSMYASLVHKVGLSRVEEELARARKLFQKYDTNRSGYLELDELRPMIRDSYKQLDRSVTPTADDASQYMRLLDASGDSLVSLEEFELHVLKALQKRDLHL